MGVINYFNAGWLFKALGAIRLQAEKTFAYIPFYAAVQRDRAAGDVGALERSRPADRHAVRGPLRQRRVSVSLGGPTRTRTALVRPQANGVVSGA